MNYPDQFENRDRAVGLVLMVAGSAVVWFLILTPAYFRWFY